MRSWLLCPCPFFLLPILLALALDRAGAFVVFDSSLHGLGRGRSRPAQRHQRPPLLRLNMGSLFSSSSSSSSSNSLDDWLDSRVVWITGASSGLGRALAIEAARHGARVALSARDRAKLEEVKRECLAAASSHQQQGETFVLVRPLDVGKFEGPEFTAAAAEVAKALGGIDLLINNAGVSTRSSAKDTALSVDVAVMATNFFGPVALTKAALPYLRQSQKGGGIVVVNSVQGKIGLGLRTSYSASKHALTGYFDSLRAELSVEGIPVTAIFPGYIKTNLSLNALTGQGQKYAKMDETTAKGLDPHVLAGRVLRAAAVGKAEVVAAPLDAKAAIFLRNLLPGLVFRILASKAKKALAAGSKKED